MSIEIVEPNETLANLLVKPGRPIRIYMDTEKYIDDGKYQIYLQNEPDAICPKEEYLIANAKKYNLILTFNKNVIEQCSNAKLFTFYTQTWIRKEDYETIRLEEKVYSISSLVGMKQMTHGHTIRLQLYFSQESFGQIPITFFRSSVPPLLPVITNNPLLESREIHAKIALFRTFQFHLAIENSKQENYFTEKLIDCLVTKTIPIYYGCPNIHEYFNTEGWILLEVGTPEEVIRKCSRLDSDYYGKYREILEENYQKALYYKENVQRLNALLKTIPTYLSTF